MPLVISSFQMVKLDSGALTTKRSFKYQFFSSPHICFVPDNWKHFLGLTPDYLASCFNYTDKVVTKENKWNWNKRCEEAKKESGYPGVRSGIFTVGVCTFFIERVGSSERATCWGGGISGESREDVLVRSPITNCYPTPAAKSNRLDSLFYSHPLILPLRLHISALQLTKL